MTEFGGRDVVIARTFVPQRLVDQNEIRRGPQRYELTGRSHADQQLAPAGKKLLRNQHGKGRADGAGDNTQFEAAFAHAMQIRMVAGPAWIKLGSPGALELPNQVAIRIENANGWGAPCGCALLPPRFAEQILGRESGDGIVVLVGKNGGRHGIPSSPGVVWGNRYP